MALLKRPGTSRRASSAAGRWLLGALVAAFGSTSHAGKSAPTPGRAFSAWADLARGDYDAAEGSFRREALEGRIEAVLGLARVQLAKGDYDGAIRSAMRAARDRWRGTALTVAAEGRRGLGQRTAAVRLLEQAVALSRSNQRARILLGLTLLELGRREAATALFESFYDDYERGRIDKRSAEQLTYVAMACRYLGNFRDAADTLSEAAALDPRRLETWVQRAEISLEKYDAASAEKQYRKALAINPHYTPALSGLAKLALKESYDLSEALRLVRRVRKIDPTNVEASIVEARAMIDETRYTEAAALLQRALRQNPTHLEALSTLAASHLLAGADAPYQATKRSFLAINPRYSAGFRVLAELAARQHRYGEAVALLREALEADPSDPYARAELGSNLLRLGAEDEGIAQLKRAWDADPYNERTYHLLELYEQVLPQQYIFVESPNFRLRAHKSEVALLSRTVLPLLERAYAYYADRYAFRPAGPIVVELYREHAHYAVRTVGLPRLAVLGVCFGQVITSMSPTAGTFNWAQVLWHELNHVFTLQLSRSRVPRWLTEGLADLEPSLVHAEWHRENDLDLFKALRANRLPRFDQMDRAFTRAHTVDDMVAAYYLSSLLSDYLVKLSGPEKVVQALRAYGQGRSTEQVWREITGLSLAQLDERFRAFLRARLEPYAAGWTIDERRYAALDRYEDVAAARPKDARALGQLALARLLHGERAAGAVAKRALEQDRHERHALYVLARLALQRKDGTEAARLLEQLIAAGGDGYDARLLLGRLAIRRRDVTSAESHLSAALRYCPEAAEPLALLARAYEDGDQPHRAIVQLKRLVRLTQQRIGPVRRLIALLRRQGDQAGVREFGDLAYHIQPASSVLHLQLAEAYEAAAPDRQIGRAIWHLETALLCQHADTKAIQRRLAALLPRRAHGGRRIRSAGLAGARGAALSAAVAPP